MIRTSLFSAAALLAASSAFADARSPAPGRDAHIVEQRSAIAFEYDVRTKGVRNAFRPTYEALWAATLKNCDVRGGYLSEYHDGFKRRYVDTREGGVRGNAYANCRIDTPEEPALTGAEPTPLASLTMGTGLDGTKGLIEASGNKRLAYLAAREKVFQTCLDNNRRVRFMSVATTPKPNGDANVEARFACNSAMDASPQRD
ncbi:hypothetical protein [Xanthomonas sp. NCPPB 2632]|uniref:hypothetical protein n=1 Tax=Xanthomonas sp. NCPPB 2632 TaxID=3240912 RepID=UPI0035150CF2